MNRRYVRRNSAVVSWYPVGLLHLGWLVLLFFVGAFFLAPTIEANVRKDVTQRLEGVGAQFDSVRVDGQEVSIVADARYANKSALRSIAGSTRCDTWVGLVRCPVSVSLSTVVPPAEVLTREVRSHEFSIERIGSTATLTGEVPDESETQRILKLASQHFSDVKNKLEITGAMATDQYADGTRAAIATVGQMRQGQATWVGGTLSVLGFADQEGAIVARQEFERIAPEALRGQFDIAVVEQSSYCDSEFADALDGANIRFQTNSASIESGSQEILENLHSIASRCSGTLVIAGHTDDRGDAAMNKSLSQARADAVRNALQVRGVGAQRLVAVGHGEEQPIADNSTAIGRATNRRIDIRMRKTQ